MWGFWLTATRMNGKIWTGQRPQRTWLHMPAGRAVPFSLWMEPIFWVMVVSYHNPDNCLWFTVFSDFFVAYFIIIRIQGCFIQIESNIKCKFEWLGLGLCPVFTGNNVRRLLLLLTIMRLLFHLDKCDDELIGWCERSRHYFVTTYSSSFSTVTFKYLTKHFIPKSSLQGSNTIVVSSSPPLKEWKYHSTLMIILCLFQVIWRLTEMFSEEDRTLRFLWSLEQTNWIHF